MVLARLCFGHCKLNVHINRFDPSISPFCRCGVPETVAHFLLHCAFYDQSRQAMFRRVRRCYVHEISEEVLLGSPTVPAKRAVLEEISSAVFEFVTSTRRSL